MNVLVIDVGGSHVKVLVTGEKERRRFASGPEMTAQEMVAGVLKAAEGWNYEAVSIGYPGVVVDNGPVAEPVNLAPGWVGFDFAAAFGRPVKMMNDAAMQALGSYKGGKMLFLGLGTGLGTAMVVEGIVLPMELGHIPYKKATFEDFAGEEGMKRRGKAKWEAHVHAIAKILIAALQPTDVVIGGGNVDKLKALPEGCRAGDNAAAFQGGFLLWEEAGKRAVVAERSPTDTATEQIARAFW